MIPVYIAGASAEHERAKRWADALSETKRVGITFRWFDNAADWTGKDHLLARDVRRTHAHIDMRAIRACRVFWLLVPTLPSAGAHTELGFALCHRFHTVSHPFIVASGPTVDQGLFTADADELRDTDEDGFYAVLARVDAVMRSRRVAV